MKITITIIALCAFSFCVKAVEGYSAFTGGLGQISTVPYAIIAGDAKNGGDPNLTFVSATSVAGNGTLRFYHAYTQTTVTTNSSSLIPLASTNGFAASQYVVIKHIATGKYEPGLISTFGGNYGINLVSGPSAMCFVGDIVYAETSLGDIPIGAATITLNGVSVLSESRNKPLFLTIAGGTGAINTATANYLK